MTGTMGMLGEGKNVWGSEDEWRCWVWRDSERLLRLDCDDLRSLLSLRFSVGAGSTDTTASVLLVFLLRRLGSRLSRANAAVTVSWGCRSVDCGRWR